MTDGTIQIACVGDVMCGDSFYALGHGVASAMQKHGDAFLGPEIVELLRQQDLVFFNMESVLSDIGRQEHSLRRLHMRGRPAAATHLARWGLTCANVANNHILEQGPACAADTVHHLRQAGIHVAGAGRNESFEPGVQIADIEIRGGKLAVLGLCLLEEKYAYAGGQTLEKTVDTVRALSQDGRIVVVSAHWGAELMDRPTPEQRSIAGRLADAGASLVVGHHPHVVQGVEFQGACLVAYSLGDFIFDSFWPDSCWSGIVTLKLRAGRVTSWEFIPVLRDVEHRPFLATGSRRDELRTEMKRRCALLQDPDDSPQQRAHYETERVAADLASRRQLWFRLLRTLPCMKPVYWPQVFARPVARRLRRW